MNDHIKVTLQKKIRALQKFSLEYKKFRIWRKQTFLVRLENPSKTAIKKKYQTKSNFTKSSGCLPIAPCFDSKLKFSYNFFDQSESSLCKLKAFHK